jgi:hypothetical protein
MRTCKSNSPITDPALDGRLSLDVATGEWVFIEAIRELRKTELASLEEIGYLLGADSGQLYHYLNGSRSTSLTNDLRIARALGYRCKTVFEKTETGPAGANPLSALRVFTHKVHNGRQPNL